LLRRREIIVRKLNYNVKERRFERATGRGKARRKLEVEYDPSPLLFPSQAWFAVYEETINDDEEYESASDGWGDGFDGDFVFEMTEMPVDEMNVDAMPEYLQAELGRYVTETNDRDYVGRAYCGLGNQRCTGARPVEDPDEVDTGFVLSATTEKWKSLLRQ
jgi:hypothetical protein